jgi:hypothetical protein
VQLKGGEFKDTAFRKLRSVLQGQARAGWYQGSLYFAVMGEFFNLGEYISVFCEHFAEQLFPCACYMNITAFSV